MDRNLGSVMSVLMPITLLSIVPGLFRTHHPRSDSFYLAAASLALFGVTLLVTVLVEVPIVRQIRTWTDSTIPENWQSRRDRWLSFHLVRVLAGLAGFVLLVAASIY